MCPSVYAEEVAENITLLETDTWQETEDLLGGASELPNDEDEPMEGVSEDKKAPTNDVDDEDDEEEAVTQIKSEFS